MAILNPPSIRGGVTMDPGFFAKQAQRQQQSQLDQLKLLLLRAQIEQAGGAAQLSRKRAGAIGQRLPQPQIPKGFEPSGVTVGPEGKVSRRFKPLDKPKRFDILKLNEELFKISHTKDEEGKTVEIEPSLTDLISLRIAAAQSGFELRRTVKTFARVGGLLKNKAIPPTFTYKLIPKKKPLAQPKKEVNVKDLTDAQIDAIIKSR